MLREHRRKLLEMRMSLGLGKPNADTLLFGNVDGSPRRPDQLSRLWRSACKSLKLPMVSFHALRHTHASALIAAGLDVVVISRRLGHASPHVTLGVYEHLFKRDEHRRGARHRGGDENEQQTAHVLIGAFRCQFLSVQEFGGS